MVETGETCSGHSGSECLCSPQFQDPGASHECHRLTPAGYGSQNFLHETHKRDNNKKVSPHI